MIPWPVDSRARLELVLAHVSFDSPQVVTYFRRRSHFDSHERALSSLAVQLYADVYHQPLRTAESLPTGGVASALRAAEQDLHAGQAFEAWHSQADRDGSRTIRFYWHAPPALRTPLAESLRGELDRWSLPYALKALDPACRFSRCDAVVLYVDDRDFDPCVELCLYLAEKMPLHPEVPLFACEIAPGLAFAEDPLDAEHSFGTSRCEILAQGLAHASRTGLPAMDAVQACFAARGLEFQSPHLEWSQRGRYAHHRGGSSDVSA